MHNETWNVMQLLKRLNQLYMQEYTLNSKFYVVGKSRCGTVTFRKYHSVCLCIDVYFPAFTPQERA
jgi:hypothetical protein